MPAKAVIDVDGSDAVSSVLLRLLNRFPGLKAGERITFSTLPETGGMGFFPVSGAVFLENRRDVTGHVKQVCQYPFTVVYRSAPSAGSEKQRMRIKEFLDTLGKWLERQTVLIAQTEYHLSEYPELESGNREIQSIRRLNSGHLNAVYPDGIEDWVISATLTYKNEYNE